MEKAALRSDGRVAALNGDVAPRPKRPVEQLERSQRAALAVLSAVASHLDSRADLPAYFASLGASIAEQCHARRIAFWRQDPRGTLTLQPVPFGFSHDSPIYNVRLDLGADGRGLLERIVRGDEVELHKGTSPGLDAIWGKSGLPGIRNSIAAAWRSGERRIGAVAAYDSQHGFSFQDVWVLRLVGLAAGLAWQYQESGAELGHTSERLEEAMASRRRLLNNIAAGGDEARRRFASALHDDSLQLLTAAELQLERVRSDENGALHGRQLDQVHDTLRQVEDSLRRLLTNVSPEPLPNVDLRDGISERLESLRVRTGIEPYIDSRLPEDVPRAVQALVLKNVGEAFNNVEKHARATKVMVVAEVIGGGVRVEVTDDGTGFVAAEWVRMPGHIGLVAMRERAQLSGGWFRIDSEPGIGTKVEFWIPTNQ